MTENNPLKDDFFAELVKFKKESDEKDEKFIIKNKRVRLNQDEKTRLGNVVKAFFYKNNVAEYFDKLFSISDSINFSKKEFEVKMLAFSNYAKALYEYGEEEEEEEKESLFSNIKKLFGIHKKISSALNLYYAIKNISTNWQYYYYKYTRGDFDFLDETEKFGFFESLQDTVERESKIINAVHEMLTVGVGMTILNTKEDIFEFFTDFIKDGTWSALKSIGKRVAFHELEKIKFGKATAALAAARVAGNIVTVVEDVGAVTEAMQEATTKTERTQNLIREESEKLKAYLRNYSDAIHGAYSQEAKEVFSVEYDESKFAPKTNYKTVGNNFWNYINENKNSIDTRKKQIASYLEYVIRKAEIDREFPIFLTANTELDYNINSYLNDFNINDIKGMESLAELPERFFEMVLEMRSGIAVFETSTIKKMLEGKTPLEQMEAFKIFFNKRNDETILKNSEENDYTFYGFFSTLFKLIDKKENKKIEQEELKKLPFKVEFIKDETIDFQRQIFDERAALQNNIKGLWKEILNKI